MKHTLLIRHRVKEYSYWRIEFDNVVEWRKSKGELSYQVFQDVDDLNQVTVISEWESSEKIHQFISDPALSEAMQESGVLNQPIIFIMRKD